KEDHQRKATELPYTLELTRGDLWCTRLLMDCLTELSVQVQGQLTTAHLQALKRGLVRQDECVIDTDLNLIRIKAGSPRFRMAVKMYDLRRITHQEVDACV